MTILDPALRNALRTLKLTGMLDTLDARLTQTRDASLGHLEFCKSCAKMRSPDAKPPLSHGESGERNSKDKPPSKSSTSLPNPKLPAAMLRDLGALRRLDDAESIILYWPVGIGKTHVAQALGHAVARRGGDVRFAKTSSVLPDLAGGRAEPLLGAPRWSSPQRTVSCWLCSDCQPRDAMWSIQPCASPKYSWLPVM
jgi:hypothetical protein